MLRKTPFKKLALLFDQLYVDHLALWRSKLDLEDKKVSAEERQFVLSEIDWLLEKGVLQTYSIEREDFQTLSFDTALFEDMQEVSTTVEANVVRIEDNSIPQTTSEEFKFVGSLCATNELIFKMEDIGLRMAAAFLGTKDHLTQYIPLVNSFDSYGKKTSKEVASHFVLNKIPAPADDTSWEQLFEFRSDPDVKRKYYALVNWINDMSDADMPLPHLADKYNQLYSEYLRQYHLHKLQNSLTKVEMLVLGGFEVVTSLLFHQNVMTAFKGLLNIRKEQIALLEGEKNIVGRELAYIVTAEERLT